MQIVNLKLGKVYIFKVKEAKEKYTTKERWKKHTQIMMVSQQNKTQKQRKIKKKNCIRLFLRKQKQFVREKKKR